MSRHLHLKGEIKYRCFLLHLIFFSFHIIISFMSDMNPTALIFGATGWLC